MHKSEQVRVVVVLLAAAALSGCGADLTEVLSEVDFLPNASSISAEVRTACAGVMTEQEILSSMLAARIDRMNGITKSSEQATALQNCAIDALLGEVTLDACTACKDAILDQVFGE